jgi:DNA (cytosine-5)-methyltransferase 3A
MRVVSFFDGISGAALALQRAGIPVTEYHAVEIDKYAAQVSVNNWPQSVRHWDINTFDPRSVGQVDFVVGGFPCQDLSIAKQGRKGLEGERSGLFWRMVELVAVLRPKWFLFENVAGMAKDQAEIISTVIGVEPVMINSALVSAQSRRRLYWCNWPVSQPADRGILLKDVLESGGVDRGKAHCIDASYHKGVSEEHYRTKGKRQIVYEPVALRNRGNGKQPEFNGTGKANSLTTVTTDSCVAARIVGPKIVGAPIRLGNIGNSTAQANRVYSPEGKSVTLSAGGGGLGAKTGLYDTGVVIRKLTPIECERLQGYPDNYTAGVSNTQRYKMLGNSFQVDTIEHILREGLKHGQFGF